MKEKEEARRVYAEAKREGKKAALVEQQRPNLFTNAVANIGPGEYVRVLIEYQQTLAPDNGEYRLRFPLAITPRYEPAGGALPDEPKTEEPLRIGRRRHDRERCRDRSRAASRLRARRLRGREPRRPSAW